MAQPARKIRQEPDFQRERPPEKRKGAEIIHLRVAANDNENEQVFLERVTEELGSEPEKLGTGRPLEVQLRDIKALRAFRNAFPSIKNANPDNLNMYVIHPGFNVAIARAFGLQNAENFTILSESKSERSILERKNYNPVKGSAERKQLPQKQDIVVVMDEDVHPTARLLRNVAPGGWILWPVSTANALRGMGKYTCKGLIEKEGVSPSVKDAGSDFWKKAEIETDEDLKNAPPEEGVVTYEEAAGAVQKAYGTTKDVVKNYKRLIELAEAQQGPAIEKGATEVMCTVERDGKTIEVSVKVILPLREAEFRTKGEGSLAIFKKREYA